MKHFSFEISLLASLNVLSKLDYDCIIVAKDALDCMLSIHKTAMLHEYCAYRSKHLKKSKAVLFSSFCALCSW